MAATTEFHADTTTTYLRVAGPSDVCPLLYFIPGNPGISEYYEEFLEELHKRIPHVELIASSHRGFELTSPAGAYNSRGSAYTLDEQIEHKVTFLQSYVKSPRDVLVISHSMGCWVAQRVVKKLQTSELVHIKFVGLLMPTVKDLAKSDRGYELSILASCGLTGSLLARIVQVQCLLLPESFAFKILHWVMLKPLPSEKLMEVSLQMIRRPEVVKQMLDMAIEELRRIGPQEDPADIAGFWSPENNYKIWMYFAPGDHWVAESAKASLLRRSQEYSHVEAVLGDKSVAHAFSLHNNIQVAEAVEAALAGFKL